MTKQLPVLIDDKTAQEMESAWRMNNFKNRSEFVRSAITDYCGCFGNECNTHDTGLPRI